MYNHSRRFVQDDEILVFENDLQRDFLRLRSLRGRRRKGDADELPRGYRMARPGYATVNEDSSLPDGSLDSRTGCIFNVVSEEDIQPFRLLPGRDDDGELVAHDPWSMDQG
jgi:hypothetical protein